MKILLKLFSEANRIGKWKDEAARKKLFQLLAHAESKSIVIWHAGKNLPLKDSFKEYITDWLSINWGGYGSSISLDNTYDYFKYQYSGDKVVDKKLKSNVTKSKGLFTDVEVFFEEGVREELIEMFKAQNGKVAKKPGRKTCLFVTKKGKRIVSHDPKSYPFFTVNKEMFKSLFPVEKERKAKVAKEKKKLLDGHYSAEEKEGSLGIDRRKFTALKKLLTSGDKDKIDSGLMLLSSLSDAYLADLLLEGVSITNTESSILEITGGFKGTLKQQPYHNYAITGILYHAPENATYCNSLKSTVTGLSIDVVDPSWLNAFVNLESLQLSDSLGQIKSLEKISPSLQIKSLRIHNFPELSDISRIADFPISDFTFSECPKIASFQALAGKTDSIGVKVVSFKNMEHLTTLDGVEFYQQLENVDLSYCSALTDARALLKCPALKKVESFYLQSCVSIDGLFGSEETRLRAFIKGWSDPSIGSSKIESINISCSGMRDLEWLSLFPNTTSFEIECKDLIDNKGLRFLTGLRELNIKNCLIKSIADLSELHLLERLSINECHMLKDLNGLEKLDNLISFHISDCENLEDISGWLSNKKQEFDTSFSFFDLKNLKRMGDMSHIGNLIEIKLYNAFNQELLADIASAPSVSILKISQDEVRVGSTPPMKMMMHITSAKVLELKNTTIEKLKLENCSIKNLNNLIDVKGLQYLSIVGCADFESLSGKGDFPDVEILELVSLPNLKSLKGLDRFPKLKRIKLHTLNSIADVSLLAKLTNLVEVDCLNCYNIEVEAKPKGQMTMTQTIKYLIKIAEHYKLKSLPQWKAKLEQEPAEAAPLSAKAIQTIKKLLQSREIPEIKSAVAMAIETNSQSLYADLLLGVVYEEKKLKPNKLFSGTGPAQPFLNTAMMGMVFGASLCNNQWKTFCEDIVELNIDIVTMDYLNCFKNLKTLVLIQVKEFTINLNLPSLEIFEIREYGWGSGITEKISLTQLSGCKKLKSINVAREIIVDNLTGLNELENLEYLNFKDIEGLKMKDLMDLSNCKKLRRLEIKQSYGNHVSTRNKINSLNGIQGLTQLEKISFQNAEISDTTALAQMDWLKEISVDENDSLVEFTPPQNAINLESLHFSDCPNLSVLGNGIFPSKLSMYFNNTGFESFPELNGVKSFSSLGIRYSKKLKDLNGLKKVNALDDKNSLELDGCEKIVNLDGIAHIEGLSLRIDTKKIPEILVPNGVKVIDAPHLTSLVNINKYEFIEKLDISSSSVKDLTYLSELKNLKFLNLGTTKELKNLKGLEKVTSLEILSLIDTENLEDISAIEHLTLRTLYIRGCKKKKSDFPLHLQNIIDWQSSSVNS
jgi:hypothetical protein